MKALVIAVLVTVATAPAHAQVVAAAYVDNNVAGDVQSGRVGLGVSAGYYLRGWLGLELDGELHGHFFRDSDVADLQPAGVDLNTSAALASGNVVVPYCVRGTAGTWCPYATAGAGVIEAMFKGTAHTAGVDGFDRAQTDFAVNGGAGVMHALTRWVGLRVDARYFHAFVGESTASGGFSRSYGYWRVSVGIVFGGPQSADPVP